MNIKERFIPQLADVTTETGDFAKILENMNTTNITQGSVVKGQVVGITNDVVIVDVGLKNEGRIAVSEFKTQQNLPLPNVGDIVDVFVEKVEGRKGTVLSREKAIREESWVKLEKMFENGDNVDGFIFGRVKGGFTVDLNGVVAFLPGSQADVRPIKDPNALLNITQPFQILKMDRKLGNIVVSRKAILEESRSEDRDKMLATIKEGDVLTGVVKNITDYGAFIDLGSLDGLLHVTDISWSRINHPSEVLSFGQEVEVMVIKFNEDTKRISLGMKQLDSNPWDNIKEEFPVGKVMTGKITNIADYGVFIELKNGIEGLVHSSEIAWGKSTQNPKKLLTIGQEVEFVILDVDTDKNRISLSIKKCLNNPLLKFAENHPVGSVIKAPIRNITDFGMFVALDESIDGMIHESDISWSESNSDLLKNYNKGDEIECKVLSIDLEKDRVALGIKQLTDDPYKGIIDEFKKNMNVTCTVTKVSSDGLNVSVNDKVAGFIKKADLSAERSEQKADRFGEGDRIDAKIIGIDKVTPMISLSVKALELDERKKAIKEYGSTDSGASLGDILGAVLEEDKKGK
ncbi:MAG TPA: 30S ribosomal protein S1 [Candidatus Megaira endosymbiont of Nemacystus decipiens]|nr:30S ribosomal protein S1 [Candidatus Megaera endosymbiont of Nemacystus decipiens]